MNGNKLPKKFWDKAYAQTPEGQDGALWACCCGVEGCDGTGKIKTLRTRA